MGSTEAPRSPRLPKSAALKESFVSPCGSVDRSVSRRTASRDRILGCVIRKRPTTRPATMTTTTTNDDPESYIKCDRWDRPPSDPQIGGLGCLRADGIVRLYRHLAASRRIRCVSLKRKRGKKRDLRTSSIRRAATADKEMRIRRRRSIVGPVAKAGSSDRAAHKSVDK